MLGFIGAGNMGSAIIRGIFASGGIGKQVGVYDVHLGAIALLDGDYPVKVFDDARELAKECDIIVLAVKPNVIASVIDGIRDIVCEKNPLFISIAAGKSLAFLEECLGYDAKVIRVMPNINAAVLSAVSAYCANSAADADDREFAEKLCSCFGGAVEIKEELFSIYSAIGGCSPAFTYMYIDSMARAAVKNGMTRKQALEVAAQAVMGSARMILESEKHPWQLVDEVCSPGGTTIEGVASLQKDGFEKTVINAVEASFKKDKLL